MTKTQFKAAWTKAHAAGMAAGNAAAVQPMVVSQRADPFDDKSAVTKAWFVGGGVCGFATIHFPGNTAFGKWTRAQGLARPAYPTGLCHSVHEFGQSLTRKEAYAHAFAASLTESGIAKVYAESRMD